MIEVTFPLTVNNVADVIAERDAEIKRLRKALRNCLYAIVDNNKTMMDEAAALARDLLEK